MKTNQFSPHRKACPITVHVIDNHLIVIESNKEGVESLSLLLEHLIHD